MERTLQGEKTLLVTKETNQAKKEVKGFADGGQGVGWAGAQTSILVEITQNVRNLAWEKGRVPTSSLHPTSMISFFPSFSAL